MGYRRWRTQGSVPPHLHPRRFAYPMLHSITAGGTWRRGVNEAACKSVLYTPKHPEGDARVPCPVCQCGLHACVREDSKWAAGYGITSQAGVAIGAVLLWGHMYSGGENIRAQFAEVIALKENGDESLILSKMYGVPLVPGDMLRTVATEHGSELTDEQVRMLEP